MDKYSVEDLNHLDGTSVLFDLKDPTIKNENFKYFKTEDLYCKIEKNDVLGSKNTHGVIENLTACKRTDEVANLKNEFIPEDCVTDEAVAVKIETTEHTLEFGTIQELEHIFRDYSENVSDDDEFSQISSKICELDKTDGKKAGKKTRDQSRGSIPSGSPKKMSRDIKTNKNKGTSGTKPKTGIEYVEQQEIDMDEEDIGEEYKCHDCNKTLINGKSLKHHIKQCHEKPTFQCYHCNKIVKRRWSLILHLRQWHTEGDKLFHCDSCTYKTNLQQALVLHVYRVHVPNDQKPSFKCKLCPHEAKSKEYLLAHVRSKHLGDEFICDKCHHKAKSKRNLISHQLIHSKAKRFSCPKCTYQTNYKRTLKVHVKYHEDNFQNFPRCPECSQLVKEANFYYHIRNHRRKKLKLKKKCLECRKEVFDLSKHLLTHAADRIQCPECSFSAISGTYLKQHIQKYHNHHEEQESFICYHCNKEIVSRTGLINHLRAVHTDDPCECHICGKKLKSKSYLSTHVKRVHYNVKWLECDLCPEESRYRTKHAHNLKRHRFLHLNENGVIMYKCEYCPYKAKMPDNLQKHVRKYHLRK